MHPLIDTLPHLSDSEVEAKVVELQRKYFATRNTDLQMQIANVLEIFKEEARTRQAIAYSKINQNTDDDLDNLINIS